MVLNQQFALSQGQDELVRKGVEGRAGHFIPQEGVHTEDGEEDSSQKAVYQQVADAVGEEGKGEGGQGRIAHVKEQVKPALKEKGEKGGEGEELSRPAVEPTYPPQQEKGGQDQKGGGEGEDPPPRPPGQEGQHQISAVEDVVKENGVQAMPQVKIEVSAAVEVQLRVEESGHALEEEAALR